MKTLSFCRFCLICIICFAHCTRNNSNPLSSVDTKKLIGNWYWYGYSRIYSSYESDTVFSSTLIQSIMTIRSDSLIAYYIFADSSWQRNPCTYVWKTDTLSLNEQITYKNWIRSFNKDTLFMELADNDNIGYRIVNRYLPYFGSIPPNNWGTFDTNSANP
jgi:hypothetical protein